MLLASQTSQSININQLIYRAGQNVHLFLVGFFVAVASLFPAFRNSAARASLRRVSSITSSVDIVLRPPCLRNMLWRTSRANLKMLRGSRTYIEK